MEIAVAQLGGHPGLHPRRGDRVRHPRAGRGHRPHHGGLPRDHRRPRVRALDRRAAGGGSQRAGRQHAQRPVAPAAGARRCADDAAVPRRPLGQDRRVCRRLQQRRPLAGGGGGDARHACSARLPAGFRSRRAELERIDMLGAASVELSSAPRTTRCAVPTPCTPTRGCRWGRRTTRTHAGGRSRASPSTRDDGARRPVGGLHALPARVPRLRGHRRCDRRPAERRLPARPQPPPRRPWPARLPGRSANR